MCLSSVYKLRQGQKELVQSEVARMEQQGEGYALYGILGERNFVKGGIVSVDFLDTHAVVLQEEAEAEEPTGVTETE